MKNNKKRENVATYVKELFSGSYTPAYINIAFLVFSVLLVAGVLYAFIANSFLTVISEPVLGDSDKAFIKVSEDGKKTYENEKFGFEITYPGDWNLEIKNSTIFKITPWEKNYSEEEVSGYYLMLSISDEDAAPKKEDDNPFYDYEVKNGRLFEFEYIPVNIGNLASSEVKFYEDIYSEILESFSL